MVIPPKKWWPLLSRLQGKVRFESLDKGEPTFPSRTQKENGPDDGSWPERSQKIRFPIKTSISPRTCSGGQAKHLEGCRFEEARPHQQETFLPIAMEGPTVEAWVGFPIWGFLWSFPIDLSLRLSPPFPAVKRHF